MGVISVASLLTLISFCLYGETRTALGTLQRDLFYELLIVSLLLNIFSVARLYLNSLLEQFHLFFPLLSIRPKPTTIKTLEHHL